MQLRDSNSKERDPRSKSLSLSSSPSAAKDPTSKSRSTPPKLPKLGSDPSERHEHELEASGIGEMGEVSDIWSSKNSGSRKRSRNEDLTKEQRKRVRLESSIKRLVEESPSELKQIKAEASSLEEGKNILLGSWIPLELANNLSKTLKKLKEWEPENQYMTSLLIQDTALVIYLLERWIGISDLWISFDFAGVWLFPSEDDIGKGLRTLKSGITKSKTEALLEKEKLGFVGQDFVKLTEKGKSYVEEYWSESLKGVEREIQDQRFEVDFAGLDEDKVNLTSKSTGEKFKLDIPQLDRLQEIIVDVVEVD